MQTSILSPLSEQSTEAQSLVGQVFSGTVCDKKDDSLTIAIADLNGELIPVQGLLPKTGLIGFTPTIKDTRYSLMESGAELFVRIAGVELDSDNPVLHLSEVTSLR
jgi:hypothetical protein